MLSRPLSRRLLCAFLATAGLGSASAGEPRTPWVVLNAAVYSADPVAIEQIWVKSSTIKFTRRPRDPQEDGAQPERSRVFTAVVTNEDRKLPELGPVSIRWQLKAADGSAGAVYEATVPLQALAQEYDFLYAGLSFTVRPSEVDVELLEVDENGAARFARCFGSGFSASGSCGAKRTLRQMGVFEGKPAQRP